MNNQYQNTGEVTVLIRSPRAMKFNGKNYTTNEIIASFKAEVELNYKIGRAHV